MNYDCAHSEPRDAAQRLADERRAAVRRVFLLTLALNAAVAVAKAGYGYASGSLTLLRGRLEGQAPDIDPMVYLTECDPSELSPGQFIDVEIVSGIPDCPNSPHSRGPKCASRAPKPQTGSAELAVTPPITAAHESTDFNPKVTPAVRVQTVNGAG